VPLVLAAAMLVALAYGAQQRLLAVAIALTASDAVFELAGLALPYLPRAWADSARSRTSCCSAGSSRWRCAPSR
jgi:hypothetical protein